MAKSVVVTDSATGKVNLSDEAYAAYAEPGVVTQTPAIVGKRFFGLAKTAKPLEVTSNQAEPTAGGRDDELALVLEPNPRVRKRRRPSRATVKEELSAEEVEKMLGDDADWKLAIPNGSATDVLTKDMLRQAWDTEASGRVTAQLRGPSAGEQALLDHAKESFAPKAGAARFTAALGASITNIALVAGALGLFLALKPEDARTELTVAAGVFAGGAVLMSLLGANLLRRTSIRLSRLDLLARRSGPPVWLSNLSVGALAAAIVLAFCAAAFPGDPAGPSVSFGKATTTQAGGVARLAFKVEWKGLGDDAAAVRTTVAPAGAAERVTVTPKSSDGGAIQELTARVAGASTVTASSQAVDARRKPVGDMTTHTYEVP